MKSRIVGLALIIAVVLITGCATSEEPVEEFDITQELGVHQETIIVNAQAILDDFQNNELRAERDYADKFISVYGTITGVGKDVGGRPYVIIDEAIQCSFEKEDIDMILEFDVGDFVTIDGFDPGYFALYVSLGDCTMIKAQGEVQEQNVETVEATEMVYRDVYYGMSKDDVIETEGRAPDTDEETLITYIETIAGKSVKLYYGFDNKSELQSIFVYSNGQHEDARLFIQDYEEIDEYLTETYGEPDISRLNWLDLARKDKPDEYIIAVLYGELEYLSTWDKGSYVVQHKLSGENGSTLTDMYAILPKE